MFTVLTRQPCEQAGFKALSRTPTIIALIVLLVSVVVLLAVTLIQIYNQEVFPPGLKYGIVLDAGSSRTTVYVYQWPAEKENDTGVVSETFKCKVKGSGISSYGNNPQDIPAIFEDCMLKVKGQIPTHQHQSTRIHLGATAGMRLLRLTGDKYLLHSQSPWDATTCKRGCCVVNTPGKSSLPATGDWEVENETAANEVLASIQSYFKSQPFDFRGAQIISGQEEGVYGWITANYLMGNFLEKNLWHMWVHPYGVETTGALDLGGASTQIAFVPGERVRMKTNDIVQVSLYGYTYTLYTHSFQCYGRNEAEKRFLAMLLQNSSYATNVINPCYPWNYSTTSTMGAIFDSLCTMKQRPASYNPKDIITFEGTGDPQMCREKVASVFDFKACRHGQACSFDGIYQPKVHGPFVAFSGFYYTASALNLSGSSSLEDFNSSTWYFCSQDWSQLQLLLPKFNEVYARSYCFSAHYIYHLLVNGYKFTEDIWPQINFENEVGNSSIAWSLGYMLSLTNQIPAESPLIHLPIEPPVFVGLLAFFAAAALLCLVFLLYLCSVSSTKKHSVHAFDHAVDSE